MVCVLDAKTHPKYTIQKHITGINLWSYAMLKLIPKYTIQKSLAGTNLWMYGL